MIITRAPLRVSFAGGGTDIPAFYKKHSPGVVVSTSINRYVYVTLNEKFDGKVSVRYRHHEMKDRVAEIDHPLIREVLLAYGIRKGVELVIASEVPARGSGLGASSALAVALCLACEKFTNPGVGVYASLKPAEFRLKLAEKAARIEIDRVGSPIGKQDHYASAMGGLNCLRFNADETVDVMPYEPDEFYEELESQSMLFYLNIEHDYTTEGSFIQRILKDQVAEMESKSKTHILQRDNAVGLWEHMLGYAVMERFQDHVNENWRIKRTVHEGISNAEIDKWVDVAYAAGAVAAKVCGAGGGGFIYLVVPPSMQDSVRKAIQPPLYELKFRFDKIGAQCIFEDTNHVRSHVSNA